MSGEKDKTVGRMKQAAGDLTGDDETREEGERQENTGKVKDTVDDAADKVKDAADSVRDRLDRN